MRHLEPNSFDIRLILRHTSISILRIKISESSEARKHARQIYLKEKLFILTLIFSIKQYI